MMPITNALLAVTLLLISTSCLHNNQHPPVLNGSIKEVPNLRPTAEDPAVHGEVFQPVPPPSATPLEFAEQGGVVSQVQWSPRAEFDLKPGDSRTLTVAVQQHSTVFASATWRGGAGPIFILVTKDGDTVASGTTVMVPPNRGTALTHGGVKNAGNANVSVQNSGPTTVRVQAFVGTLPGGQQ